MSPRVLFALAVAALFFPGLSSAQAFLDSALVTNGPVYSMVRDGDRVYIGGDFTSVGPGYGGAVGTHAETGQTIGFPKVAGSVYAIVPDGKGGWYLGGTSPRWAACHGPTSRT